MMDEKTLRWTLRVVVPLAIIGWILAIGGTLHYSDRLDEALAENREITTSLERLQDQLARGEAESERATELANELASALDDFAAGNDEVGRLIAEIADDVRRIVAGLRTDGAPAQRGGDSGDS
jgi:ABC-type transporter Mla subunit MlaD